MLPTSKSNQNITQGPKSSQEFNNLCRDIKYDISTLFQETNKNGVDIEYNMNTLVIENFFLQAKINSLQNALASTESMIDSHVRVKTVSFNTANHIVNHSLNKAYLDVVNGIISTPYSLINKNLVLDHNSSYVAPSDLEFNIYEATDSTDSYEIIDYNKMKTFDGNNASIWYHTSKFDISNPVDRIYIILKIKLPLNYINNTLVNAIGIKPFPEGSMNILNVQYSTPNNNTLVNLPNFPTDGIQEADKVLLHFPSIDIEDIYILLEQPYYFMDNNYKYFYYGMQEIGIYYLDFNTEVSYVLTEFDIDDYYSIINEPTIETSVGTPTNIVDLVSHQLYFDKDDIKVGVNNYPFGATIIGNYKKAYILTKIKQSGGLSLIHI